MAAPLEPLPAWAQLGVAGAALGVLVYVFVGMRKTITEVLHWASNHMSEVTRTQANTAESMSRVADAHVDLKDEVVSMRRAIDRRI